MDWSSAMAKPLAGINAPASGRRNRNLDPDDAFRSDTGGGRFQFGVPPGAADPRKRSMFSGNSDANVPRFSGDASGPYDPVKNPLRPRPMFLRYDPNRHQEILQRQKEMQGKAATDGADVRVKCLLDTSSPSAASSPSSSLQSGSYGFAEPVDDVRVSGKEEKDPELEEEKDGEGNDDAEEKRPSFAKTMLRVALVWASVLLVLSHFMASTPHSSTTLSAESEFDGYVSPNLSFIPQVAGSSEMCPVRGPEATLWFPDVCSAELLVLSEPLREEEETAGNEETRSPSKMVEDSFGSDLFYEEEVNGSMGDVAEVIDRNSIVNAEESFDLGVDSEVNIPNEEEAEDEKGGGAEIERGGLKGHDTETVESERGNFILGDNLYQLSSFGNPNVFEEYNGLAEERKPVGNVHESGLFDSEQSLFPLMTFLAGIFSVLSILPAGILKLVASCKEKQEAPVKSTLTSSKHDHSRILNSQGRNQVSKEKLVVSPSSQPTSPLKGNSLATPRVTFDPSSSAETRSAERRLATRPPGAKLLRELDFSTGIRPPVVELLGELDFARGIRPPVVELLGELDFFREKTENVSKVDVPSQLKSRAAPSVGDCESDIIMSRWKGPEVSSRSPSSTESPEATSLSGVRIDCENVKGKQETEGRRKRVKGSTPPTPATVRRSARIQSRAGSPANT